jgi:exosortase
VRPFLALWLPVLIAYGASLVWIAESWWLPDSYFAHGPLVVLAAAVALWLRRKQLVGRAGGVDGRAWWVLGPGLLLHFAGAGLTIDSLSASSLVLSLPGLCWLGLGAGSLRALAPVLGLVPFAIPLPMFVSGQLAFELKEFAVEAGIAIANLFGAGAVRDGVHLRVPGQELPLLVADPCSGLRSLVALLTLGYCIAFLFGSTRGAGRLLLLLAAVPLALGTNALRIGGVCLIARSQGVEFASTTGHEILNAGAWIVDLAGLLLLDRFLASRRARKEETNGRRRRGSPDVDGDRTGEGSPVRAFVRSSVVLWALAPLLCWLSCYRPPGGGSGRAEALPAELPGFVLSARHEITARYRSLLGTDDATWRTYRGAGGAVFVVAVFHERNWKSLHPPHICLRGSDMTIRSDSAVELPAGDRKVSVGRIVTWSESEQRPYLSLYAFVAPGLVSGSYFEFFVHHLPRALFRLPVQGCLLRVETWLAEGSAEEPGQDELRARQLFTLLLAKAEELLR